MAPFPAALSDPAARCMVTTDVDGAAGEIREMQEEAARRLDHLLRATPPHEPGIRTAGSR